MNSLALKPYNHLVTTHPECVSLVWMINNNRSPADIRTAKLTHDKHGRESPERLCWAGDLEYSSNLACMNCGTAGLLPGKEHRSYRMGVTSDITVQFHCFKHTGRAVPQICIYL
jgi:hypothetical protein